MIRDPFYKDMQDVEKYPRMNTFEYAQKYINLTMAQKKGLVDGPTAMQADELCEVVRDYHPTVDGAVMHKHLEFVRQRVRKNLGLFHFFYDYGAKSEFFIPWLESVPSALALVVAFGQGYDMHGRFRDIPKTDPFYQWVIGEGMFVYLRTRAVKTAKLIKGKQSVLFLGAGYLNELRYVGYKPPKNQHIVAYDLDSRIPSSALIKGLNGTIDYRTARLTEAFSTGEKYDAIIINGVMSYCYDNMAQIIHAAIGMLNVDGTLMFDLQLAQLEIIRDAVVFDWKTDPPMRLVEETEIEPTIKLVDEICRNFPIAVSHNIDDCKQSLMFKIHKFKHY